MRQLKKCSVCESEFLPDIHHPHAQTCSRKCSSRAEYLRHKDAYFARAKSFIAANPEKFKTYQQKCHTNKPEQYAQMWRAKTNRRRALVLACPVNTLTAAEFAIICAYQNDQCWWCGVIARLQIDHVVPLIKGGHNSKENVVGACKGCNSKKRDKLWDLSAGVLAARNISLILAQ